MPMELHANIGDTIEVDARQVGERPRRGEVVEVIGQDDNVHYRVLWQDGRESTFYPASTAHVVHHHQQSP
jgi:hypothetical protein